jgi:hypothetical protein
MCDPPGAGKTFAVIALILQEVQLKRSVMRRMGLKPENMPEGNDQNIIVVPFNIYTQWEECIRHGQWSSSIRWECSGARCGYWAWSRRGVVSVRAIARMGGQCRERGWEKRSLVEATQCSSRGGKPTG